MFEFIIELLIGGIFLSMLIFIGYRLFLVIPRKAKPAPTAPSPTTTTKTSLPLSVYLWRIGTVAVIGSLLWHETRESFWMGVVPNIAKEYVVGEVLIPYKMVNLEGGTTQNELCSGLWRYVGVQKKITYYQLKKNGTSITATYDNRAGGLASEQTTQHLPVRDRKMYGNILVTTSGSSLRGPGQTVAVEKGCEKIHVSLNLPREILRGGYSLSTLGDETLVLLFKREE